MDLFNLKSNDLKNLGQHKAVDITRRLLWVESSRVGIERNLIDVPDCINVGDGGLDAVIENASPSSEDIIPRGFSGFQIKSSNLQPQRCRKELHQTQDLQKPLKPEISRLLDSNGTYILVIFAELTHQLRRSRKEAIKQELIKMGYANAKVRVYSINQMMSFLSRFPALVSWIKGYRFEGIPYDIWAKSTDVSTPKMFVPDEQRKNIINEMQEHLRTPKESRASIFRITGVSGLGKTRLVFESLSPHDLKNKVVYLRAAALKASAFYTTLLMDDSLEAIVVVDECSLEDHELLVRFFSKIDPRLSFVTISQQIGDAPSPTLHYKLGQLATDEMKTLLSHEVAMLPQEIIDRIVDFADGYPRIAVLLSENYLSDPSSREDILRVNDEGLINRLVAGRLDSGSDHFRKTKRVLTGLALFEKIGYKGDASIEAEWLANFIKVDWGVFQEIINEQKQRGVVQGDYYIYVTPFLLAVHLVREWWTIYGDRTPIETIFRSLPKNQRENMMDRFTSRFPYITSTEPGRRLVKELLSKQGIFENGRLLETEMGSKFFSKLTDADAESALQCLKRTIGAWSKEKLIEFKTGRREIVWALQKIAVWKEFFADAARLFLVLGEAENEIYANNASGVFVDLFSPARGRVSPTEASPEERFPVLIGAIGSKSIERKKLALRAFRSALQTGPFHRFVGAEYQGSRAPAKLWTPKTYKEIFDYQRKVWNYLAENLEKFDNEIRDEAADVLIKSARGLAVAHPSLSSMVIRTIRTLAACPWLNKAKLLETVSNITHYDNKRLPKTVSKDWIELKDDLTGSDFSSLLKRFVGLDLLQDYYHNSETHDTRWIESQIRKLAQNATENPELLVPEYSWLTKKDAKRGHLFGYELGKLDSKSSMLNESIKQQRKAGVEGSINFLGGYFRALFQKDLSLWEEKLELLSKDDEFKKLVPELTWRSGMTDRGAKRILLMAKRGDIPIDDFWLFRLGGVVKSISEPVFVDYVKFLLDEPSGLGALIALELSYFRYFESDEPLDKILILSLVLHQAFLGKGKVAPRNRSTYYWKKMVGKLIDQYPDSENELTGKIIESFGFENSITRQFDSSGYEILSSIAKRKSPETWKTIAENLGPPLDRRAFFLTRWLRGEKGLSSKPGALELFNLEEVWEWVDEDPGVRAPYIATFVPPHLFHSKERLCPAREMLIIYGDREDVRSNFTANYSTESWTGSASVHFSEEKKMLLAFKKNETNENVLTWIGDHLDELDNDIERAKIREELRF